ncbi:hypothetical protein [Amycolatopsis sp. NPDC059657]|uniref:hypothetical protein n=1 Tax=Amycolatopsis sp. NPDC059657 TaxID=3346899 RepID=UPI003670A905
MYDVDTLPICPGCCLPYHPDQHGLTGLCTTCGEAYRWGTQLITDAELRSIERHVDPEVDIEQCPVCSGSYTPSGTATDFCTQCLSRVVQGQQMTASLTRR